ncbi:MAG: SAM-dependent methyltransferase, partial [Desulfobacteraceae bacterium]|nr:SAM-dependent methyltransferase [Desulfobacteraceae bacterium]
MDNIFTKDFWIKVWQEDKENQTYDVHRGFSSVDYWDKAAKNYNSNKKEKSSRRLEKTLDFFKKS